MVRCMSSVFIRRGPEKTASMGEKTTPRAHNPDIHFRGSPCPNASTHAGFARRRPLSGRLVRRLRAVRGAGRRRRSTEPDRHAVARRADDRAVEVAAHDRRDDVRHHGGGRHHGDGAPNATTIMNVVGGTGSSQRHMFQEISYGIQDTQPMYFGPYTLPVHNCLTIACCGPSSDKTGNGATVQSEIDALGMTFNHYFWVYGKIPSGANCGTWGDEGSPSKIATYSSYSFHDIVGYSQEIGHNFGMTHEPTMCCGGTVSGNRTCTGGTTFADSTDELPAHGVRELAVVHGRRRAPPVGGAQVPPGLDERLQPGEGRRVDDDHAAAAGASLQRRAAAADPGAEDAAGSGHRRRPPGLGADADALLPRDARAATGSTAASGRWCWCRSVPICRRRTAPRPYVYLLDTNPGTTTLNDAGLRAGGELQRSGRRPHDHGELDRHDQRERHHHDDGHGRADVRRQHGVHRARSGRHQLRPAVRRRHVDGRRRQQRRNGRRRAAAAASTGTAGTRRARRNDRRGGRAAARAARARAAAGGSASAADRWLDHDRDGRRRDRHRRLDRTRHGRIAGTGDGGSTGTGTGGFEPDGHRRFHGRHGNGGSGATGTGGSGPGEAAGGCSCDTTSGGAASSSALFGPGSSG